jgi:hypothetical protein
MRLPIKFLMLAGLVAGWMQPVLAHHSNAAYDMEHPRTIEGVVMEVNWTNPHITFHVEEDAKEGANAVEWVLEASSPSVLNRSGWTKRSIQPGDHASFRYAPLRDGALGGFLSQVTLPSGTILTYSLTPAEQ